MDFNPPEIVKMLKQQQRFYQEQLRLVEIALNAIESQVPTGRAAAQNGAKAKKVKKHRIQWTREIDRFLDDYDEFSIMDIQSDLAEKREIAAANTIYGQNVITNTLNRFEKKGRIQKIRPGVYQVIKEAFPS